MSVLVSIIIPVYNRVELISQTLKSIVAQNYTNWECLIVDDGSSKENRNAIKNLTKSDKRIQFLERPRNRKKGANACRNFGLENSKGEYIVWFDSDDIMHENYLKSHVELLNESSFNLSICRSEWITLNKKSFEGFRSSRILSKDPLNDYIQIVIFWPINAVCYKKQFLLKNNLIFDESLQQSQEYDFHVKVLLLDDNYGVLNKTLVKIMATEDSISYSHKNAFSKTVSSVRVRRRLLKLKKKTNLEYQSKLHLLNDLHRIFQQETLRRHIKSSFYVAFGYLIAHFTDKRITTHFLIKHFVPVLVVTFTYNFFGKGYVLFKKSNTFNYTKKSQ